MNEKNQLKYEIEILYLEIVFLVDEKLYSVAELNMRDMKIVI